MARSNPHAIGDILVVRTEEACIKTPSLTQKWFFWGNTNVKYYLNRGVALLAPASFVADLNLECDAIGQSSPYLPQRRSIGMSRVKDSLFLERAFHTVVLGCLSESLARWIETCPNWPSLAKI